MTTGLLLWILLISTLASLLFSTLSYALRTISRVQLEEALAVRKRIRAMEAILSTRFDLSLTASILRLVCNTAAIMAAGALVFSRFPRNPGAHVFAIFGWTVLITVPAMMIFTVAIPQAWAKYAGEPLLAMTWPVLRFAHFLAWPLVRVLKIFDEIVRRLAGVSIADEPETAAEKVGEEILSMVAEGTHEGTVDAEQQKMIEGVISFRDLDVGQIMTPRTEVVAVDVNAPLAELREKILREGLSRLPVYDGTLDNVVGILYAKDFLPYVAAFQDHATAGTIDVRKIMRPPLFVPRSKPLRDLLREFRDKQVHMAVVLDEYGGTSGLVTTEDIIEEIVGDIADEYERPAPDEFKRIDDRTVEVDAKMSVVDINRELGLSLPEDADYTTIGGFVISKLGMIPPRGEALQHDGLHVQVLDAEPRRVKKLRLELPAPATAAAEAPPIPALSGSSEDAGDGKAV